MPDFYFGSELYTANARLIAVQLEVGGLDNGYDVRNTHTRYTHDTALTLLTGMILLLIYEIITP